MPHDNAGKQILVMRLLSSISEIVKNKLEGKEASQDENDLIYGR